MTAAQRIIVQSSHAGRVARVAPVSAGVVWSVTYSGAEAAVSPARRTWTASPTAPPVTPSDERTPNAQARARALPWSRASLSANAPNRLRTIRRSFR